MYKRQICNDSGKIDGLPPNRLYGHADFLAGSFAVSYTHLDVYKRQVVQDGQRLADYLYGRGRLGRHITSGNAALVLDVYKRQVNGHLTQDVNTFHTNGEGILTLPEKLPLGKYRICLLYTSRCV